MKTIKTRDIAKKSIRTLQDGKNVSNRMRSSIGRTVRGTENRETSGSSYTTEKIEESAKAGGKIAAQLTKKGVRSSTKAGRKIASKSVKTSQKVSKQVIKQSVKTTKQSAKVVVKMSQKMAQSAKALAKMTAAVVKTAVKVITAVVKMIIAATKTLVAAIASGGWVAVLVIVIICVIILIGVSVYGIFFSQSEDGLTMQQVVRQIDDEYDAKINQIKLEKEHDIVRISGDRAPWKEVLAVYSVKVSRGLEDPAGILSINEEGISTIKEVFWTMNQLDFEIKKITVENEETGEKEKVDCLYITAKAMSFDEAAAHYSFTEADKKSLYDLMDEGLESMWVQTIYGISTESPEIVAVAASQIGNTGGEKFWSWYGFSERVEWCACFVSWCANECGYIEKDMLPKFSYCDPAIFIARNQWRDTDYEPKPGDLVFFDWIEDDGKPDGEADHVGIVEKIEGDTLYTIEGNRSDACGRYEYSVNDPVLFGYIVVE